MRGMIGFFLLLLTPLGFIYKKSTAVLFIGASWAVILPALVFVCGLDLLTAVISVIFLDVLLAGSITYRSMVDGAKWSYVRKLKDKEEEAKRLSARMADLARDENDIREKELAVVKLYEITKRMSGTLKFDEILLILGGILRDNFRFRRGRVALVKSSVNGIEKERVYNIPDGVNEKVPDPGLDHEYLIRMLTDTKRECFFDRAEDPDEFARLKAGPDVNTISALPLMSENKMMGIIILEDMQQPDLEKFAIVAMQFALEIKKVFLYEKVEDLAITDGLTGLFVRRYFMERFDEELKRSKRHGFSFAFLMLDIDNFKKCNDTYGHLVGDVVLRDVSRIIKEHVREIDLVGRFGGEEFSLVLPETGRDGAVMAADRLRENIQANVFRAYDEKLKLTVSIGVAIYPQDSDDTKDIIEKADQALYAAKKSGKNIVCESGR